MTAECLSCLSSVGFASSAEFSFPVSPVFASVGQPGYLFRNSGASGLKVGTTENRFWNCSGSFEQNSSDSGVSEFLPEPPTLLLKTSVAPLLLQIQTVVFESRCFRFLASGKTGRRIFSQRLYFCSRAISSPRPSPL